MIPHLVALALPFLVSFLSAVFSALGIWMDS